jgi:hypothetical protein
LLLEVRVKNLTGGELSHVVMQNCFHFAEAPDFACRDFSQIYLRMREQWRSMAELGMTDSLPMFYREGFSSPADLTPGKAVSRVITRKNGSTTH